MAHEIVKRALYGTPKVGGDCLSFCTKCKMELAHVIVSMVGDRPAKVLCKTCKSQHNHRKQPGEPTPKPGNYSKNRAAAAAAKPKMPTSLVRVAELWQKKLTESKAIPHPYVVSAGYKPGDLIEHPKFGTGLVEETRGLGKILVLFREGEKVLVHSIGNAASNASAV